MILTAEVEWCPWGYKTPKKKVHDGKIVLCSATSLCMQLQRTGFASEAHRTWHIPVKLNALIWAALYDFLHVLQRKWIVQEKIAKLFLFLSQHICLHYCALFCSFLFLCFQMSEMNCFQHQSIRFARGVMAEEENAQNSLRTSFIRGSEMSTQSSWHFYGSKKSATVGFSISDVFRFA